MIEITESTLSDLLTCCAVEADERTFCGYCGKQAYAYVKEVGELAALRTINHTPDCTVDRCLHRLDESVKT